MTASPSMCSRKPEIQAVPGPYAVLTAPARWLIVSASHFRSKKTTYRRRAMAGKADLVNSIVDAVEGLTRRQAAAAFEAVVGAVSNSLKAGESVKIPGLGSFAVAERGARKGRNPATGESITIKASKTVRFKAGKDLKEAVNTKKRGRKASS